MTLVNFKKILEDATKGKYAIFATDPSYFHFAYAAVEAAIEKKSPVIIQVGDGLDKYFNYAYMWAPLLNMVKEAPVPVAINLDHGLSYEQAIRWIKVGCTAVMFDGSRLPLEENIRITREIVKVARCVDVSVEGEVGVVGGFEQDLDYEKESIRKKNLASVSEVERFVEETGVDAIAVAVGTIHGIISDPIEIDFERISTIRNKIKIPMVLHGGSGLSDEMFKQAIMKGMAKVNYYTGLLVAGTKEIKNFIANNSADNTYNDLIFSAIQSIKRATMEKMDLFGSTGKGII
jgi:fructose-bisphosphate aldolase class II